MRIALMSVLVFSLTACGDEMTDEEKRAAVEANQEPPVLAITPEAIRYPDIEKHEIYGASCAFVPDGGGLGAIAIAMADAGYMKIDGEVLKLAPDAGSGELPLGAREKYTGTRNSFLLSFEQGEGERSGYETRDFRANLLVRDDKDREVYSANGLAQCGV